MVDLSTVLISYTRIYYYLHTIISIFSNSSTIYRNVERNSNYHRSDYYSMNFYWLCTRSYIRKILEYLTYRIILYKKKIRIMKWLFVFFYAMYCLMNFSTTVSTYCSLSFVVMIKISWAVDHLQILYFKPLEVAYEKLILSPDLPLCSRTIRQGIILCISGIFSMIHKNVWKSSKIWWVVFTFWNFNFIAEE